LKAAGSADGYATAPSGIVIPQADCESLKRFVTRKRTDTVLYNIASVLAGVGAGFDIRVSNSSTVHPCLLVSSGLQDAGSDQHLQRSSVALKVDQRELAEHHFASPIIGACHSTYHGCHSRYRPTVNFDVPIRFGESFEGTGSVIVAPSRTPSIDNRVTPSADSWPSLSFSSGGVYSQGRRRRKGSADEASELADIALISLSPSTDKAFVEYQRQLSDTSSVFDLGGTGGGTTPAWTTPKSTPHRTGGVKFEETIIVHHHSNACQTQQLMQSPSVSSNSWGAGAGHDGESVDQTDYCGTRCAAAGIPSTICPPPTRRSLSQERGGRVVLHGSTAERPVTLDIIPRPRPHTSTMPRRGASPVQHSSAFLPNNSSPRTGRPTPTPLLETVSSGGDDSSYFSAKSGTPPGVGSTSPPSGFLTHLCRRTLLDIDVVGQKDDGTKPLPARPVARELTLFELEQEFLS